MTRSRWIRGLALLMAFGLAATACGSDERGTLVPPAIVDNAGDSDDAAPTPGEDEPDEPTVETTPEEPEQAEQAELGQVVVAESASCAADTPPLEPGTFAPSGDFSYAISLALNSLNPHDDQTPATFAYYSWIYEGLVRQEADGSVGPWLARCWETSDDGSEVTFYLHEGVTFHDGTPLNAAAVVANVEFVKTAGPPQVIPPVAGQLGIVDTVEAVDEHTVKFNLAAAGEILLLSGLIRNSGLMVSPAALGDAAANPIGTGPYMWSSSNPDFTENDLAAFADYWQPGLVGLETVRLEVAIDQVARLDAFNAGQYDVAVVRLNDLDLLVTGGVASNFTVRIGFVVADWTGEQIPQLANREVRCAMAQALNRQGIAAQLNDPESVNHQFATGPSDYAYIDDLDVPEFDIEAAKARFAATGEEGFTFTNGHLPGGFWPVLSSAWGTALSELGITMQNEALDPPTGGEMFGRLARGVHPVQIIPFNEPNALMSLVARTGTAGFNPSGSSPDGVIELVNAARGKDFTDGENDVAAAWKILLEECIFIVNNTLTTVVAYQDGIEGVHHTQGLPIHFWPHGVTKN
ncbi:ABC transporter substrate-binding protein [Candidatus Poriferisodalis sp.]|uniref:ABC transporter substrate-binding protein n=1 Tax=Candidatus Poriferisodalis sp. TaxID=3101277 RepID=UPI003B516275